MGICSSHFRDPFIQKFINDHRGEAYCDICKENKPSTTFERLQEFIKDAVCSAYCDPYDAGAPYDPEGGDYEDSFWGLKVYNIHDLLYKLLEVDEDEIVERLAKSFRDELYLAARDQINGPSQDEYFGRGWALFKETLKHKVRFLFFDPKLKSSFEDEYEQSINPILILKEVKKAIVNLGLILKIPNHSLSIYRARQHQLYEFVNSSRNLGSPPPSKAKAGRMSPAGISMFYGALDIETCRMEILDPTIDCITAFTSGEFLNIKELKIVDFTIVMEAPSLFDEANRHKRSILKFILSFIADLSVPVKPDDSVHIDYIPTQVVTEYLRLKLRVDGILYNSVKRSEGKCIVLFADYEKLTDIDSEIERDGKVLGLLTDSIVTDIVPASSAKDVNHAR